MKNSVYKNASIVTGISVAERALGFLYRIVLSRLIGAEGLGLYQVALSLFSLLQTLVAGGIPTTLSRAVAKEDGKEHAVATAGVALTLFISLPLSLLFLLFGDKLTFLFSDTRGYPVLRILLLGLFLTGIYAALRGYFWGKKRFFTASVLELSEEIVMVIAGIFLLQRVHTPLEGAERAAWAVVISYLFSALLSVFCFFFAKGSVKNPKNQLKPLFNSSLPITSVRASSSLITSAVAVLLPAMLIRAGLEESAALEAFGVLSGMVMPVLFIPSTLIGSLSLVLIPELSADYYKGNTARLKGNIERGLTFAFLVACALLPFFYSLGEDVGRLAFLSPLAGELISKGCVILLPMSLTMLSTSALNSIGFEKQTFLFYFCGAATLLLSVLLLPPVLGEYAYLAGLCASYLVTAICNLLFLKKKCPIFQKRFGSLLFKTVFPALLGVLPLSLCGQLLLSLSHRFLGELLAPLLTGVLLLLCTLLYYFAVGLLKRKKSTK